MSTWQHDLGEADPALKPKELDKAIAQMANRVEIVRTYRVPLLAGYCSLKDWEKKRIVYADYRLPKVLRAGGKTFDPMRYIMIHECVEASLMADLDMDYSPAHTFATAAEEKAVIADGLSWKLYCLALKPWVAKARIVTATKIPPNIDKTCYRQSHELHLLKEAA